MEVVEVKNGYGGGGGTTVCVTGASGFIGSWLVMRLLQLGYYVRATVRDPDNTDKVKHLLDLPNATTHLSLWKADLDEDGSFDDAIQGCDGVFHVATPMNFVFVKDPERLEGIDESLKPIPCPSKKLLDLGFKFKYNSDECDAGDLCAEAI